ncbi:MAG: glycoside hydrolase family 30 beta sandwich domain-containing protein [Acidimicrobiales bacterium]
MRRPSSLFVALALVVLTLAQGLGRSDAAPAIASAAPPVARSWLTTGDGGSLLVVQPTAGFSVPRRTSRQSVTVDDSTPGQVLAGYGAALTDSSAWLLSQLSPAAQDNALRELFSSSAPGAGLSVLRIPLGASDFVVGRHYSYDDQPPGGTDPALAGFSIARDQIYLIPLLLKIKAIRPDLQLMATPWSAPGWMKSTDSLIGGSLLPAHEDAYARYLVLTLQAYAAAGAPIDMLTIQNEPGWAPPDYPGMVMPEAQQAEFVAVHLAPTLAGAGLHPALLGYDHNWDDTAYATSLLRDTAAGPAFAGAAFHCYAGDVSSQSTFHAAVPDAAVWTTECSGGDWGSGFAGDLVWGSRNLVVGAGRNWSTGVLWWNVALDPSGGPHTGGCSGCRGLVTVDPSTGAVVRNVEYWTAAHATVASRRGAVRVASTTFGPGNLETLAWRNPDGSHALEVVNSGSSKRSFRIAWNGWVLDVSLAGGAVGTWSW